jgi:hypothetical protein
VAALKKDEIAVKAIDGATYEIDFTDSAVVTDKNHKKIDRAKVTVGERVMSSPSATTCSISRPTKVQLVDR